jgi:hypothetical protein
MPRKKVVLKLKHDAYSIISDALEHGLQFAINRLEDHGAFITEEVRASALPFMLNELLLALDVIDWDKSK